MEFVPDHQNEVNIHGLPDEIITYVFRFLNTTALVLAVPKVCTRWSRIAESTILLRVITFQSNDSIDTKTACAKLVTCSANLNELNILDRKDTVALLNTASRNNKSLISLNIRGSKVSVKKNLIRSVITGCPDIQNFTVTDTLGESDNYLKELSVLRNLKKVSLGSNQKISKKDKHFFASPNADVEHFCSSCPQLTELTLPATRWTDAAVFSILQLKNLEVLGIRFGLGVTPASLIKIPQLENLRSLDFSFIRGNVTPETWISMFSTPTLMQLKVLGLSSCFKITDEVLAVIAANCQQLERIQLTNCIQFTETGFEHIITNCKKLIDINVYCTRYCIANTYPLIPMHIPRLQLLVVGPWPLPDDVRGYLMNLQSELPFLKVQKLFRP